MFFCSWGLCMSSFLRKKYIQSEHCMNIWLGPEFNQSFLPTCPQLNWACTVTALRMVGSFLTRLFVSIGLTQRILKTAVLLGAAISHSVYTMCHFWTSEISSSKPLRSRSAVNHQHAGAQREGENTLNWNLGFKGDGMLSRLFIFSLLNHFPFCST